MKKGKLSAILGLFLVLTTGIMSGCKSFNNNTSGLQYKDRVVGEGELVKKGDTVSVHYTGWLENGKKFDSSVDRGTPFEFTVGTGEVIAGWDEGVEGMHVGGTRELIIPSDLAYGNGGIPGVIPGGAILTFEVEVLEVL